jgi:hypothetical protein
MAFSQANIDDVTPGRSGAELLVTWTSTDPEGTVFQVYLDNALAWSGTDRAVHLPWPGGRNLRISVGAVAADEGETDFSASLSALAPTTAELSWEGGTFLAADIAGFRIYKSATAGGPVDFTAALAEIPAYPGGVVTDGYGMGGYGHGGYGRAATTYAWESAPLGNGSWTFAVSPFDEAGNEPASPSTVVVVIAAPPRPPAADARGVRLTYSYDSTSHVATLAWFASPA